MYERPHDRSVVEFFFSCATDSDWAADFSLELRLWHVLLPTPPHPTPTHSQFAANICRSKGLLLSEAKANISADNAADTEENTIKCALAPGTVGIQFSDSADKSLIQVSSEGGPLRVIQQYPGDRGPANRTPR